MKTETIKLYEEREDVTLTTYILEDSPEMLNGKKRPAVLICPGGAYLNCSDREAEPVAMKFASMGYHTFVLRYSVYNEAGFEPGDPQMLPKPERVHPAPMREMAKCMMLIKKHAEEWKVDGDKIAVCGFSAGAHNCGMYATNWYKPVITDYFKEDKEWFRPAAVILGYCLSDYVYMHKNMTDDLMAKRLFSASDTAYLGTAVPDRKLLEEVSPARNVTENTPRAFLWATAEDDLVPVQHTILMAKALADKKIPFELHIFEKGTHGLSTATQASAASISDTDKDAAKWTDLCDAWLMKRFAIELPQMTPWQKMILEKKKNEYKSSDF